MLVLNRFRIPTAEAEEFRADLQSAHDLLAKQKGYLEGWIGRNLDDPELWTLTTRWDSVGAYRRGVAAYEVKLHAWTTLGRALDEPSAFEVVAPNSILNVAAPRVT